MSFSTNVTFGCRALDGPSLGLSEPLQLSQSLSLHPRPPVDLDETWQEWLGTLQGDSFSKSRLVIVAQLPNSTSMHGDNLRGVETQLQTLHCGLLLQGYGYCSGGLEVYGNTNYSLHLGPLGPVFPHAAVQNRKHSAPTIDKLEEAYRIAQSLQVIYDHPRRFLRLRRSFDAWYRGIREGEIVGYRLHNFVRAVEGLTQPPRFGLTNSFVERAQMIIGRNQRNASLLRQLYNLRSCFEHIKRWRPELRRLPKLNVTESLLYRTLQAELLASAAFITILTSTAMLHHFRSDATISRFWALGESDRRKQWGRPFPLQQEARRLYWRV